MKDTLEGIEDITDDIAAEERRTNEIMMTIMENTTKQISLNGGTDNGSVIEGSILQLMQDNTATDSSITNVNGMIGTQNMTIDDQKMANDDNQMKIDELEPMIQMMAATTDYFDINEAQITFTQAGPAAINNTQFCVPMGVPYEFYATIAASGMFNGYLTDFSLRQDDQPGVPGVTIAASSSPSTTMGSIIPRDRDMSILFKGTGTGQNLSLYQSAVTGASIGNMPIAEPANFQWGVKTFTTDFAYSGSMCATPSP